MNIKSVFHLQDVFPDAAELFQARYKHLSEIKEDCIFVFDTNILLAPYDVSETDIPVLFRVFDKLKVDNRLFIPGRVAREFAKNRGEKISQVFLKLRQRQKKINTGHFKIEKLPLVSELASYKEIDKTNEEIVTLLKELRKKYVQLESDILDWNWDDPISTAYKKIFDHRNIFEMVQSTEDVLKDLAFRQENNIPPGYKDSSKPDNGVGDLIIWNTIIEIAKNLKKDVVFVSNDKKSDWYYRQDESAIYPRFELLDEFRRRTSGRSINIIDFSKFLSLFIIDKEVIDNIESTINKNVSSLSPKTEELLANADKIIPGIKVGCYVRHKKFRDGKVLKIDGHEANPIATINFIGAGEKRMMLRFAKLTVLPF